MVRRVLPIPDPRAQLRRGFEARLSYFRKRGPRRDRDLDDGGVPVEPGRPRDLSGGAAAAALEFDD
jgi:hypothetical protein